jgi:pyruvate kinase
MPPRGSMEIFLPPCRTKIIGTVGPSCEDASTLETMIRHGMTAARLNFSHGTFEDHRHNIAAFRSAAAAAARPATILADLPGPKIRIGQLANDPLTLEKGNEIILTTDDIPGTASRISVRYKRLPESLSEGDTIYLNDGFVELTVLDVQKDSVRCMVASGGSLLSGKGLNLPGRKVFLDNPTDQDLEIMEFALAEGIDIFGVSFVEDAGALVKIRDFAAKRGKAIHTVAKIERAAAIDNIDSILDEADAIMIARGDLGIEIPIEDMPSVQKELIHKANERCRPVITATQMLMSMVEHTRPTRAEVTDVANAIQDGTDAIMLSEETAVGRHPVTAVTTMAAVAASFERRHSELLWISALREELKNNLIRKRISVADMISLNVAESVLALDISFVLTSTVTGMTPRRISRLKPSSWIIAACDNEAVMNFCFMSSGVYPLIMDKKTKPWHESVVEKLKLLGIISSGDRVILTEGQFSGPGGGTGPGGTDTMAILTL